MQWPRGLQDLLQLPPQLAKAGVLDQHRLCLARRAQCVRAATGCRAGVRLSVRACGDDEVDQAVVVLVVCVMARVDDEGLQVLHFCR